MSDPVRYQIHIRRLFQIKQRPNQYPVYNINSKGNRSPSPKKQEMDQIISQIKKNKSNILTIQRDIDRKKPVNYEEDDKYIYDREVEKLQKEMMKQLINKNKVLKNQVKSLQKNFYSFHSTKVKKNK